MACPELVMVRHLAWVGPQLRHLFFIFVVLYLILTLRIGKCSVED